MGVNQAMRHLFIAAGLSALLCGCGGGGSGAGPSARPTGLVIVAQEGVLFLGQTYTFTASLQMSDGTSTPVAGTWGSDAPTVAFVQASTGQVQILGIGEATVFVDAQGLRGTRRIRATVHYQGELDGVLRVTSCSDGGIFAEIDVCGETPNGTRFGFLGGFTQNGETVVATMDLGEWPADPVTATVNGAGELRFSSEHRREDEGLEYIATAQWVFRPRGTSQIEGTAVWRARVAGLSGFWELRGDIVADTITRSLATGASPGGAPGVRSLGDAVRVLRP